MSRDQYYDPWAKVAQSAQNAMFQYLQSRPNPQDQALKQAQLDKANLDLDGARRKQSAQQGIADSFKTILAPGETERPAPEFEGPMPFGAPSKDVVNQRFNEQKPQLLDYTSTLNEKEPMGLADIYASVTGNGPVAKGGGSATEFMFNRVKAVHPEIPDDVILRDIQTGWRQGNSNGPNGEIVETPGYFDFTNKKENAKSTGDKTGELDVARQANYTKAESAIKSFEQKAGIVDQNINKALGVIDKPYSAATGNLGAVVSLGGMLASDRRELDNYLATIKANSGFDQLQTMRDNSPTGGALGPVSDMENKLLQAINGALDPMMEDQLKDNLKVIKESHPKVLEEKRRAFQQDYGNTTPFGNNPTQAAPAADPGNITVQKPAGESVGEVNPATVPPIVQDQLKGPLMPTAATPSGWDDGKESRLQELYRKKAAGGV